MEIWIKMMKGCDGRVEGERGKMSVGKIDAEIVLKYIHVMEV